MIFDDLKRPNSLPECTTEQILLGPTIDPRDHIKLYDDTKFEEFIEEWAFYYLKEKCDRYERVIRLGGAGDKGRDVIGYVDENSSRPVCDTYQCKHYKDKLNPTDLYPELAKLCVNIFNKNIPTPANYYVVAPLDLGPKLGTLMEDKAKLKAEFIKKWLDESGKRPLCKQIGEKPVSLKGKLKTFVNRFDYSIIKHKPILEVVEEFRLTHRFASRFGGGLNKPLPKTSVPTELKTAESRYIDQLVSVYQYDASDDSITADELLAGKGKNARHFNRSRERFFYAETLREFAKDNLPDNFEYSTIQDDVLDGVADTLDGDFDRAIDRVNAATEAASKTTIGNHPLKPYVKGQSLRGICHQLANDDRIVWLAEENDDTD